MSKTIQHGIPQPPRRRRSAQSEATEQDAKPRRKVKRFKRVPLEEADDFWKAGW